MVERRAGRLDLPREPRRVKLPRFDPEAFGRWSEGFARFMGTPKFLVYMTVVVMLWFGWNTLAPQGWRFDPYTFTFMTLILSLQASYAAPLILLAQNRLADRDRVALEEDRRRAGLQKADTEYLSREIAALRIALGDVATRDFLRSELTRLADELSEIGRDAKTGGGTTMLGADGRKETASGEVGGQQMKARRQQKAERKAAKAASRPAADRAGGDEPDDETGSDAPHAG